MPYSVVAADMTVQALVDGAKVATPLMNILSGDRGRFDYVFLVKTDAELRALLYSITATPALPRSQVLSMLHAYFQAGAAV